MSDKEVKYRGYTIYVSKENKYSTECFVTRDSDQWFIIDTISYDEDTTSTWISMLKQRVDEFIKTKGASEELEDDYEN